MKQIHIQLDLFPLKIVSFSYKHICHMVWFKCKTNISFVCLFMVIHLKKFLECVVFLKAFMTKNSLYNEHNLQII